MQILAEVHVDVAERKGLRYGRRSTSGRNGYHLYARFFLQLVRQNVKFLTSDLLLSDTAKTSKLKEQIEHESTPLFASARL